MNDARYDNIENMALADLLGMADESGDGRVQEREDEPGSGIAKLAMLVATTSIEEAKRPSLAPIAGGSGIAPVSTGSSPPGNMASPMGSVPPGGMVPPTGSVPPGGMMPPPGSIPPEAMSAPTEAMPAQQGYMQTATQSVAPQMSAYNTAGMYAGSMGMDDIDTSVASRPKSKTGLFVGICVGLAAVGAAAYFLFLQDSETLSPETDSQMAQLQAKLDSLKEAQAAQAPAQPAAEATKPAVEPKPAEAAPTAAAPEKKEAEPAIEEEAAKKEEAAKPAKPLTRAQRRRMARAKKIAAKKAKGKQKAAKSAPASADTSKETPKTSKATAELDSLLTADVASGKKSASKALPDTPSRKDVKSSMRPIQAKASKCKKYSKGTVNLKVVVGSNGRVKSSTVVGGTAKGNAANCVAMIARTARFPAFKNATFSFNYPVTIK
jgi:outer membrane biosynthesis protein TonB